MYRTNQYAPPPAPRRFLGLWIALGVVAVLMLVGVASAVAFFVGARRSAEKAAAATTASAPLPAASVSQASAVAEPPADAVDEPAPLPGTPASSLRARPPWGKRAGVRGPETQQYAPQLDKPIDVFLQAKPMSGDLARGFVICRFQSFNKADTFAGDDLHVRAKLGATPEVATDGPEDGNLAFLSAPLVTLNRGDPIAFEVFDRDVFTLVPLTRTSTKYDGPLVMMDTGAAIECRSLAGPDLARVMNAKLGADASVQTLSHARLNGTTPTWGWPSERIASAERAIMDLAALSGWDDARVKKRLDGLASATAALTAQRAEVFKTLHAGAKPALVVGGVTVTLVELACVTSCAVRVTLKNEGDRPAHLGGISDITTYVATAASGPVASYVDGKPFHRLDIPAHASVDATLSTVSATAGIASDPAIFGVCDAHYCRAILLR